MSATNLKPNELLDQILNAGREFVATSREQSGELTKKGRQIAAQGEDILVDKLGVEDTEAGREALRKGLGAGAAAGAFALLLSSRSGRKIATIGGLTGLGMLAYKAFEKNGGKMPNWKQEISGLLSGPKAQTRSESLLRAMVAAAKADGELSTDEVAMIQSQGRDVPDALNAVLSQEPSPAEIAALADSEQAALELYAVSCRIADGTNPRQRKYLDQLAMALRLDPTLAARIETDVRTG